VTKNKTNIFSCSLWFQEKVLLVKKRNEQGFLRNLTKKHTGTLWIKKKFIPDPGGKEAPDPGSATLIH
jgi:hypothetical protein